METIEIIEEKPMTKRLIKQFIKCIMLYGILYVACMAIFIMIAIFMEQSMKSIIIMSVIDLGLNFGFMMLLSKDAICTAFNGINTVDVPNKSRHRILKTAAVPMVIFMIGATIMSFIALHSLFTSKIQVNTYQINSEKGFSEVKTEALLNHGIFTNVNKLKEEKGVKTYLVSVKTYAKDAQITIILMIIMNIVIGILGITYENNLLKRYLIPAKK